MGATSNVTKTTSDTWSGTAVWFERKSRKSLESMRTTLHALTDIMQDGSDGGTARLDMLGKLLTRTGSARDSAREGADRMARKITRTRDDAIRGELQKIHQSLIGTARELGDMHDHLVTMLARLDTPKEVPHP